MPLPEIKFANDGALVVCCGPDACVTVRVETPSIPATPAVGTPLTPTPIKATMQYAQVAEAHAGNQMDDLVAEIQRSVSPDEATVNLLTHPGDLIRIDAIHELATKLGRTPVIEVGSND